MEQATDGVVAVFDPAALIRAIGTYRRTYSASNTLTLLLAGHQTGAEDGLRALLGADGDEMVEEYKRARQALHDRMAQRRRENSEEARDQLRSFLLAAGLRESGRQSISTDRNRNLEVEVESVEWARVESNGNLVGSLRVFTSPRCSTTMGFVMKGNALVLHDPDYEIY